MTLSRQEFSEFMNWRFDRLRGFPLDAVLIAAACIVPYFFLFRLGFNLADEGFLWYGTMHTALGEVPMRDFQSYDPGRYYWGALWIKILGDGGIISFRFNYAAFQFIGMVLGLSILRRRILKSWWALAAAGLVIWMWMGVYESVIMISAIYFAVLLIDYLGKGDLDPLPRELELVLQEVPLLRPDSDREVPFVPDVLLRRLHRQIASRHPGIHNMPLTNPRPLRNPLVVGRDHLLEIGIGQQPRRHIRPYRTDLRAHPHLRLQRQAQTLTSPGLTAITTKNDYK